MGHPYKSETTEIGALDAQTSEDFALENGVGTLTIWGTFVADLQAYFSPDDGVTWVPYSNPIDRSDKIIINDQKNDRWKIKCTDYTSGTAKVNFTT